MYLSAFFFFNSRADSPLQASINLYLPKQVWVQSIKDVEGVSAPAQGMRER